jgi:hypothetical protein
MDSRLDNLTLNQLDDVLTRIQHAKAFLQENPDELLITAACIYGLPPSTLYSSINRALNRTSTYTHSNQNKILQEHQKEAIR